MQHWTLIMMISGACVSLAAWHEHIALFKYARAHPAAITAGIIASGSLALILATAQQHIWLSRALAGLVAACVLGGYFGASYPVAIHWADTEPLLWVHTQAPTATLDALAIILLISSALIFPALSWLYRIFKQSPNDPRTKRT